MMDASTAIKLIRSEHSFYNDDRARIDVEPEWQQAIDFIEQQEKDAEIGRAALKLPKPCLSTYGSYGCLDIVSCGDCENWKEFCRLRAERGGEDG